MCINVHGQLVQHEGLEAIVRNKNCRSFTHQLCATFAVMAMTFARCPFKGSFFRCTCLRGPPAYDFEWSNLADERVAIVRGIIRLSLLRQVNMQQIRADYPQPHQTGLLLPRPTPTYHPSHLSLHSSFHFNLHFTHTLASSLLPFCSHLISALVT